MRVMIAVRYSFVGFHRWPGAPEHRAYLADLHRHKFFVEASVEVFEDDREIEFHDFLDFCQGETSCLLGGMSCEMIARKLANAITASYPGRNVSVSVFEDDEVGAVITLES